MLKRLQSHDIFNYFNRKVIYLKHFQSLGKTFTSGHISFSDRLEKPFQAGIYLFPITWKKLSKQVSIHFQSSGKSFPRRHIPFSKRLENPIQTGIWLDIA